MRQLPSDAIDETMDAIGFDREAFLRDEQAAARAALAEGSSPAVLDAMAERAAAIAGELLKQHLEVLPPDPEIACGAGCAACCRLRADVTVAEVARLVRHLRRTRSPAEIASLRERVDETALRVGRLGADARAEARVGCALLDGDRCSVYEERPLVCRGCNSASADDCERALGDGTVEVTVYAPQKALYRYAGTAIGRALAAAGLDGGTHELHVALSAALADKS
jgi:Fe-S-cluster containining protein